MNNKNNLTRGTGILENFLAKQRANKANKLIKKDFRKGRILDIGCGSYPYFLIETSFKEKYGVDPSINLSLIKKEKIEFVKKEVGNQKFLFQNNFFDVVTMLAVFEHIDAEKLTYVLKEIYRVLKADGVLIITTPAPWSDKLLHQMAKLNLISSEEIHEHKHHHSRENIVNLLGEANFEIKNIKSGYFEIYMNMWFTAFK